VIACVAVFSDRLCGGLGDRLCGSILFFLFYNQFLTSFSCRSLLVNSQFEEEC